jgi:hypothetical protein
MRSAGPKLRASSGRDREFESASLQRGVQCEPNFRGRIPSMTAGISPTPTQRQRRFMREKSRRPWPKLDFPPRQNYDFQCAHPHRHPARWAGLPAEYSSTRIASEGLGDDALGDTCQVAGTVGSLSNLIVGVLDAGICLRRIVPCPHSSFTPMAACRNG